METALRAGLNMTHSEFDRELAGVLKAASSESRITAAIQLFRSEDVTFLRAAEIAGMDFESFRLLLVERGITRVIEADDEEDRSEGIEAVMRMVRSF